MISQLGSFWGRFTGYGLLVALVVFVLDFASKYWVVKIFWPENGCDPFNVAQASHCRVEILPFIDFTMAWNTGISYGLFAGNGGLGRHLLILFTVVAIIGFFIWLSRCSQKILALSIGLIMGGALGNGIDRVIYGAVADFVSLHGFGFYWYIFNVADVAIVAGAAGLLYEIAFDDRKNAVNGH